MASQLKHPENFITYRYVKNSYEELITEYEGLVALSEVGKKADKNIESQKKITKIQVHFAKANSLYYAGKYQKALDEYKYIQITTLLRVASSNFARLASALWLHPDSLPISGCWRKYIVQVGSLSGAMQSLSWLVFRVLGSDRRRMAAESHASLTSRRRVRNWSLEFKSSTWKMGSGARIWVSNLPVKS